MLIEDDFEHVIRHSVDDIQHSVDDIRRSEDDVKRRGVPTPLFELAMSGNLDQFEGQNLYSTNHCRYFNDIC